MATGLSTQLLQDLGSGWLKLKDANGFFYVHRSQAVEILPPDLARQAEATVQKAQFPVVKGHVGQWMVCHDQSGEYYHHTPTQMSYDDPPLELLQQALAQKQEGNDRAYKAVQDTEPLRAEISKLVSSLGERVQAVESTFAQMKGDKVEAQVQGAAQQQLLADGADRGDPNARVKQHIGPWAICQDAQGEYYHDTRTATSYDDPPPELSQILRRQPQGQPQQQLRPMPQQQQPLQQRVPVPMQAPYQSQPAYTPGALTPQQAHGAQQYQQYMSHQGGAVQGQGPYR